MTEPPRERRPALDVAQIARNVPFVLRTVFGLGVLGVGINVIGVVIIVLLVLATDVTTTSHQLTVLLTAAAIVTLGCVVAGVSMAVLIQRRTLRWLLRGEAPSETDARRALQMPLDMAIITAVLWTVGGTAMGIVVAAVGVDAATVFAIVGGTLLSGFTSAGITYLFTGRVNQPVARLALAAAPPRTAPVFSLRLRLLVNWILTSALPLIGVMLVLSAPRARNTVIGVSIVVALLALVVGAVSTLLVARAIGAPLRSMVDALHRVGEGRLDVGVPLEDAGEIGLLQNGFNDMVAGLRERDRVKDLFGRHVGSTVAQEALRSGVTLSGELRDAVAVFVDITGSTRLSRETEPTEFVAMLNRFYAVVVDEVESSGGLLNKFEGDAALCLFGVPAEIEDAAGAALGAARRIRDRVWEMAEVDVGVGVAAGPVVAGQIGTASRLEYTVIGDAVNQAARLTDLAKECERHLLASGEVLGLAADGERDHWTLTGEVVLRGHEHPTTIWTAGPVHPQPQDVAARSWSAKWNPAGHLRSHSADTRRPLGSRR